jgi:hypothetical protein
MRLGFPVEKSWSSRSQVHRRVNATAKVQSASNAGHLSAGE